jgi:hypothetical protein
MVSLSRTRLLLGLALLAAALLPASAVQGQAQKKKDDSKAVSFDTADGVKISGTLWPGQGGKRDAVVMLLHNFDLKKGGSSQQEGWSRLAKSLQADGYTVLSFDFRGFGDSKSVNERFWSNRTNMQLVRGGNRKPDTIDHSKFTSPYMPYLINDIAAAKAYLDRRNDAGQMNSANVILIGAGEGAALGALWLKNECRRRRDTNIPPLGLPQLAGPEISDIACGVWLSIRPGFNNRVSAFTRGALYEAGNTHKVPMAFIYGAQDTSSKTLSEGFVRSVKGANAKGLPNTGFHAVPATKLADNKLLEKETINWIMKDYLEKVLEARGAKEQKDRKTEASAYWYTTAKGKTAVKLSKPGGQEAPVVDIDSIVLQP